MKILELLTSFTVLFFCMSSLAQTETLAIKSIPRSPSFSENEQSFFIDDFFSTHNLDKHLKIDTVIDYKYKLKILAIKLGKKDSTLLIRKAFSYYNYYYNVKSNVNINESYYIGMAVLYDSLKNVLRKKRDLKENEEMKKYNLSNNDERIAYEKQKFKIQSEYQDSIDMYNNISVEYFFKFRNTRSLKFGVGLGRDKAYRTSLFYENNSNGIDYKFLNNYGLNIGSTGIPSVSTEIYKDYFSFFRFSISSIVNSKVDVSDSNYVNNTELKDVTLQRIISGGGNFVIKLSTPALHFTHTRERLLRVVSSFNFKNAFDVPRLGTINNDVNWMVNPYINAGAIYSGYNGQIAILADLSIGYLYGGDNYFNYLNINDSKIRERGMFMNKAEFGIGINKLFRITYSYMFGNGYWSEENLNQFSISFVPN